jgi:hypothetical protein
LRGNGTGASRRAPWAGRSRRSASSASAITGCGRSWHRSPCRLPRWSRGSSSPR